MRIRTRLAAACALVFAAPVAGAGAPQGIVDQVAPPWGVSEWINVPDGRAAVDVSDLRGKVVYLYGFQSWCPGCHAHGFPTLLELIDRYAQNPDVVFVAVQTTFEGFEANDAEAAWKTAARYALDIPVGHDGIRSTGSVLMRRYRSGGTPWIVLIDRNGIVRFNDFHIPVPEAIERIDHMLAPGGP